MIDCTRVFLTNKLKMANKSQKTFSVICIYPPLSANTIFVSFLQKIYF